MKIEKLVDLLNKNGLDLHKSQLYSLAKAGNLPEPKRGEWDDLTTIIKLAVYYRTREENRSGSVLDLKRQEKIELESALLRRKIEIQDELWMRVEDVRKGWLFVMETIKAKINTSNIPAKDKLSILETLEKGPEYSDNDDKPQ